MTTGRINQVTIIKWKIKIDYSAYHFLTINLRDRITFRTTLIFSLTKSLRREDQEVLSFMTVRYNWKLNDVHIF